MELLAFNPVAQSFVACLAMIRQIQSLHMGPIEGCMAAAEGVTTPIQNATLASAQLPAQASDSAVSMQASGAETSLTCSRLAVLIPPTR